MKHDKHAIAMGNFSIQLEVLNKHHTYCVKDLDGDRHLYHNDYYLRLRNNEAEHASSLDAFLSCGLGSFKFMISTDGHIGFEPCFGSDLTPHDVGVYLNSLCDSVKSQNLDHL